MPKKHPVCLTKERDTLTYTHTAMQHTHAHAPYMDTPPTHSFSHSLCLCAVNPCNDSMCVKPRLRSSLAPVLRWKGRDVERRREGGVEGSPGKKVEGLPGRKV